MQKGVDKFAVKNGLLVFRYKDKGKVEVLNPEGFFNCIILNYG